MTGLFITFAVLSAVWLVGEAYRAPVAYEGSRGFVVLKPGRSVELLLARLFVRAHSLAVWGYG